jgi:hypothetical protein
VTVTILDIIRGPVPYVRKNMSEIASCLNLEVLRRERLTLVRPNLVDSTSGRKYNPLPEILSLNKIQKQCIMFLIVRVVYRHC